MSETPSELENYLPYGIGDAIGKLPPVSPVDAAKHAFNSDMARQLGKQHGVVQAEYVVTVTPQAAPYFEGLRKPNLN